MRLFIIGGKANVGKNTLAKYIKEYYDKNNEKSIITEYSKYIKLISNEMIDWIDKKNKPRKFLQDLGEEYRKIIDPYVFINRMKEDILVLQKYYQNITFEEKNHITETELENYKDFDYELCNDNFDKLKEELYKILDNIK